MNIIRFPERKDWAKIVERPHLDVSKLNKTVADVLADIKKRGDDAVKGYELKFDHVDLPSHGRTPMESDVLNNFIQGVCCLFICNMTVRM